MAKEDCSGAWGAQLMQEQAFLRRVAWFSARTKAEPTAMSPTFAVRAKGILHRNGFENCVNFEESTTRGLAFKHSIIFIYCDSANQ
jgi:hypothetical protein